MATFKEMTGKTIADAWLDFHRKNPKIYQQFVKYALYLLKQTKHRKKISGILIINRIRWEVFIRTADEAMEEYKINENYAPYYTRLFIKQFPQFADRFELRKLKGPEPDYDKANELTLF